MQTLTEKIIEAGWADRVLTERQFARLLEGSPQRRYNLVNRALSHGELLRLRRGRYLLASSYQEQLPHPFILAQALRPGSYISFETALSFHGWVPESVPVTLSVVTGRRRDRVEDPRFGAFLFYPLALRSGYFLESVDRQLIGGQAALVAQPLRALLDIVCLRKLDDSDVGALVEGMRIDVDALESVQDAAWQRMRRVYQHRRMEAWIEALRRSLAG